MKFVHLADCHLGGFREQKLKELNLKAFQKAIDECISEKIDFLIIAGDLFNTSLPPLDILKEAVKKLKHLKDSEIPVYIIAGSHDFSPSGKTILDVLENAGLVTNVLKGEIVENKIKLKFTIDKKTGAKITGIFGKKGQLEKTYYENLIYENLESEQGFKIFLFHSLISELKPKEMQDLEAQPLSFLPKGFDYYAGGHPHFVLKENFNHYKNICYPGPIFPNNFKEIEELKSGGYFLYNEGSITHKRITTINVHSISINCKNKNADEINKELKEAIYKKEFYNTLVTLRLSGEIESNPKDIQLNDIIKEIYNKGAYLVLKNTIGLHSKDFEEIKVKSHSVEEIENLLIKEHSGKSQLFGLTSEEQEKLTKSLMKILSKEKEEDEKSTEFEKRIIDESKEILKNIIDL